jgi:hypothetical protein
MYFIYRPDGPDSIWVPYALVEWTLRCYADKIGEAWHFDGQCQVARRAQQFSGPLPEWERNSEDLPDEEEDGSDASNADEGEH